MGASKHYSSGSLPSAGSASGRGLRRKARERAEAGRDGPRYREKLMIWMP